MNVKAIFSAIAFVAALSFAYHVNAGGFGISPPLIISDNLLKGSRFEQTIYLVQSEPDRDLDVEAVIFAPGFESWISINKGSSFVLPKGEKQFPMKVTISVPEDAEEGKYKGHITINTKPEEVKEVEGGSSISINLGGRIDLDLAVGDDVFEEYKILSIDIKDIESNWPVSAVLNVQNTGNVPIKLDRAVFDLFDKYNSVRLGYGQTEDIETVPAYSDKEIPLKFPIDLKLGLGEYSGTVRVYKDEKVVKELQTAFNVVEKGALSGADGKVEVKNAGMDLSKSGSVILVLFLALSAIIFLGNKNMRKKISKGRRVFRGKGK